MRFSVLFDVCAWQSRIRFLLFNYGRQRCDKIEEFYHGKANNDDLYAALTDTLADMDMLNINFPSENVKNNWKADMVHFCNNFSVKKGSTKRNKDILLSYSQTFLCRDILTWKKTFGNDEVDIIDFKTSSKFSAQDL